MRLSDLSARVLGLWLFCALPFAGGVAAHEPLVIAHRGASGYLPEHTLAAYALAIEQGAHVIEPDLVFTRDGVLVARHDRYLSTTTDVTDRSRFASRKRALDGREDWYVEDFTLAELKTLRARQRFDGRPETADGLHAIPTLQEVIDLVRRHQADGAGTIGLYPETKSPSHFLSAGHDFAEALPAKLAENALPSSSIPVIVQSFEAGVLRRLNAGTDLRLVQLVRPKSRLAMNTPNIALDDIVTYADGVGAGKYLLITLTGKDSGFVAKAHALGLFVHAWTFRDDAVPPGMNNGAEVLDRFLGFGIDGFFTDFPDTGVAAVRRHRDAGRGAYPAAKRE